MNDHPTYSPRIYFAAVIQERFSSVEELCDFVGVDQVDFDRFVVEAREIDCDFVLLNEVEDDDDLPLPLWHAALVEPSGAAALVIAALGAGSCDQEEVEEFAERCRGLGEADSQVLVASFKSLLGAPLH